jgi:hypothetical protein
MQSDYYNYEENEMGEITENLRSLIRGEGRRNVKKFVEYSPEPEPRKMDFKQKFKVYQDSLPANPFEEESPFSDNFTDEPGYSDIHFYVKDTS